MKATPLQREQALGYLREVLKPEATVYTMMRGKRAVWLAGLWGGKGVKNVTWQVCAVLGAKVTWAGGVGMVLGHLGVGELVKELGQQLHPTYPCKGRNGGCKSPQVLMCRKGGLHTDGGLRHEWL